jgi:hypothetical protein
MHRHGNSNAFVLNSSVPRQSAHSRSQPTEQGDLGPITHTFEVDTGYFRCQEYRCFYPYFNYEVVKVQTTDLNNAFTPTSIFYILNFPIDQLSDHLMRVATQLFDLRSIGLYNPLFWEVFVDNHAHILEMTLTMLRYIPSLTRITLCVDILCDALFCTLRSHLYLRELEILLPSSISFTFPGRLAQVGAVLNRGISLLPQVEHFKIPIAIVRSFPSMVDDLIPMP